jgi:hypothetical protein
MGYYINSVGCDFTMKKANSDAALKAIKDLFSQHEYCAGWVDTKTVLDSKTFEDALSEAGFDVDSRDNNYFYIQFNGEKYSGDEKEVLNAISPFVKDGSYIEMIGEEGERWRWIFHKNGVEEKYAKIVWD